MNALRPIVLVIFPIALVFSSTAFSEPIQDISPFRAIHLEKGQSFPLLAYFLYPCNLLHGEESHYALTVRERGDTMVDLVAVNQSPLPAPTNDRVVFYKEIRAELLPDAGFSAKRCLLKRMNTHRMDTIVLMDFSGHRQTPFGYFPEKVTITRWWQRTSPEIEPESKAMTYLLPSNLSWDFNQDFSDRTFSQQWEGTLQDVRFNIDLNDETFWPSVPEGYTYSDKRACYKELEEKMMTDRSALTKDEKALLAGIDPHAFAK